jgi:GxxExxY protein
MSDINRLSETIIGFAIELHRHLGPGLAEATYERALCIELSRAGVAFQRQIAVPVYYKGEVIGEYRPDLIVADLVVVEVKSVERLSPVHRAQMLAYLRVTGLRLGLLLNFNEEVLRSGIRRVVL